MAKARASEHHAPKQGLRKGEYYRESDKLYCKYVKDSNGERKRITGKTLEILREKEASFLNDVANQIKPERKTVDACYYEWLELKRGIVENTKRNYKWIYEHYVLGGKLGRMSAKDVTKGTIKLFYNKLRDQRGLSVTTIDGLHTVIRQVFAYAVDERYILANPAEGAITELKREAPKRQAHPALTKAEQDRFLNYIESAPQYRHWLNIFKVFIGTGMRVSELTGLRWKDVSFEEKTISVNHGLAYYKDEETGKMSYQVGKPKTKASRRKIVVIDDVLDALKAEKAYQQEMGIVCQDTVKGNASADETFYTDFIFLNKDGHVFNQNTLNKAIRRISRDANAEAMDDESLTMLPKFSCHCFRSTFITRSAEVQMPIQVIMRQVGHDDIDTTVKIYTTVNPDWQQRELAALQGMFK